MVAACRWTECTINQLPFQTINKIRGFKMGYLNIISLCKHIDELHAVMESHEEIGCF